MPYCEKCNTHYQIGILVCPDCKIGLLEFKIEGINYFRKLKLEYITKIYRWANESVYLSGSIDWKALLKRILIDIGVTKKKANEYIEIVTRLIEDKELRESFERRFRMGMYDYWEQEKKIGN